jgi:hypothetical protein
VADLDCDGIEVKVAAVDKRSRPLAPLGLLLQGK